MSKKNAYALLVSAADKAIVIQFFDNAVLHLRARVDHL